MIFRNDFSVCRFIVKDFYHLNVNNFSEIYFQICISFFVLFTTQSEVSKNKKSLKLNDFEILQHYTIHLSQNIKLTDNNGVYQPGIPGKPGIVREFHRTPGKSGKVREFPE